MSESSSRRRHPIGAEIRSTGVSFRVWAPRRARVAVVVDEDPARSTLLRHEGDGYFSGVVSGVGAGDRYRFRLDDDQHLFPDPASRFQPEGPHGPSQIVDPGAFAWTDGNWPGVRPAGNVFYELHVGTFTSEGTWRAAIDRLPHLADLGITLIEVMPVNDFSGSFGWGYDGVNLFAPTRLYGTPDDFRRFIDRAHALGIGVILDVVYNHFGPDGNYLCQFSEDYFTDRHSNDWGTSINFDDERSGPVREFFITNAAYWIDEFHLDGLRFDATQDLHDDSAEHIVAAIARAARAAAGGRALVLVAENEPQQGRIVRPIDQGGWGLDALWNDDLHHSATVALTGRSEAYYTDYTGTAQELLSSLKWGFLYQGQWYQWQEKRRGSPTRRLRPSSFVTFLQNHDQVANSGGGLRCGRLGSPSLLRTLTAMFLLAPGTPMLFQGQEFDSSAPFLFFASHHPELAALVVAGRRKFLAQFPRLSTAAMQDRVPDPADPATFARCRLDWSEIETHAETLRLHRDLLRLRRTDPVLSRIIADDTRSFDGAVIGPEAFVLRYFDDQDDADRLLVVNLGRDLDFCPAPEPLLADPEGRRWKIAWSSEDPEYGGLGVAPMPEDGGWRIAGRTTTFYTAEPSPGAEPVEAS